MEAGIFPAGQAGIFLGGVGLCLLLLIVRIFLMSGAPLWPRLIALALVVVLIFVANLALVFALDIAKVYQDGGMWPASLAFIVFASAIGQAVARSRLAAETGVARQTAAVPKPRKSRQPPIRPTSSAPPDVFISYKRDERALVGAIAARLNALKVSVWFDAELKSGTSFDAEIAVQVRAARCVLVCWSPGAVASEWVRSEATIGRERGVLAAALLKPCDLPPPFNLVHTNDLRAGITHDNPEWIATLDRIGELVRRPGLSAFEAMGPAADRRAIADWLATHPHDPLFEEATQRLKSA